MKIHDVEEEMSENQGSIYIYREGEIFYSKILHTYDLIINIDKLRNFNLLHNNTIKTTSNTATKSNNH